VDPMLRASIVLLLFLSCLSGCTSTSESITWKSRHVDLNDFNHFEIQPVANATGRAVSEDILSLLTAFLREQFAANDLQLPDSRQAGNKSLLVQTEILEYKVKIYPKPYQLHYGPPPPSGGDIGLCIVRTRLVETSSNQVVAEVITVNKMAIGKGLLEPQSPDDILERSATAIAKEIARMM